jgi:hypothetical protein
VGQGWQNPLLGAQTIDYRGSRNALGRTADGYAIWDTSAGGAPVQTFPLTDEGWAQAWAHYQELEGPAAHAQAQAWRPSPTTTWRKGQPLALGPMRVGQILDGAFRLYRMRFGTLIAVVGLVLVPFQILVLGLTLATLEPVVLLPGLEGVPGRTIQQPAAWVTLGALAVQILFVNPLLTAAVVKTAADTYVGRDADVGSTYRAALPRVHSILWVTFLAGLAGAALFAPGLVLVIVGAADRSDSAAAIGGILMLAAAIPALIIFLRFSFAPAVVMVEGTRGTTALRRSWRLVRGLTGKVLGTSILAGLIVLALLFVLGVIFGVIVFVSLREAFLAPGTGAGFYAAQQALNTVGAILTTPFFTLVSVLLYFDSRTRKEGFDLAFMAQQIGAAPPAGA